MAHYIDRDALAAEIEKRIKNINLNYVCSGSHPSDTYVNKKLQDGISESLQSLLPFIDTFEVKEVDLEKEIEKCLKQHNMLAVGKKDFTDIANHFFELGIKAAQNERKSCTTDE